MDKIFKFKETQKIEIFIAALAIVFTVLAVVSVLFYSTGSKYSKLIKWSSAETPEQIFEPSLRRLFPYISEANHINIKNNESLFPSTAVATLLSNTFNISAQAIQNPDLIFLNKDKKNYLKIDVLIEHSNLDQIDLEKVFDARSLIKLKTKIKDEKLTSKFVFCLYQTQLNTYVLHIIKI